MMLICSLTKPRLTVITRRRSCSTHNSVSLILLLSLHISSRYFDAVMFYFICIYYRLFEANRPRIARTTCSTIPGGNISLDMVISRHVTVPSALAGVAHAHFISVAHHKSRGGSASSQVDAGKCVCQCLRPTRLDNVAGG